MSETLFHGFFDDAAIFPPGLAPLEEAVRDHIRRSQDPVADAFIGPLILPVEKVDEAVALAGTHTIGFSVTAPAAELAEVTALMERLRAQAPNATVVALEAKVGDDVAAGITAVAAFAAAHADVETFVELPYTAVTDEHLSVLAAAGLSLKFRTGGIRQELFPTPEQVVVVIAMARRHGLRFKLTAGLHRAMRYADATTGFRHFGFLNIAAATAALHEGSDVADALRLLNSDDSATVARTVADHPGWRESFHSFGTCSIAEPAETLTALGMLDRDTSSHFH